MTTLTQALGPVAATARLATRTLVLEQVITIPALEQVITIPALEQVTTVLALARATAAALLILGMRAVGHPQLLAQGLAVALEISTGIIKVLHVRSFAHVPMVHNLKERDCSYGRYPQWIQWSQSKFVSPASWCWLACKEEHVLYKLKSFSSSRHGRKYRFSSHVHWPEDCFR